MHTMIVESQKEWSETLTMFPRHDFHHTFDFHAISQENGEGDPQLFVTFTKGGEVVACWPSLKRSIPSSDYFDLGSVYGYPGPLFTKDVDPVEAKHSIYETMRATGAVSLFSRTHPVFMADVSLDDKGEQAGDVVVIDIDEDTNILATYRGSHRREIVQAKKAGVATNVALGVEGLDAFVGLYRTAMQDLEAASYYNFCDQYFERLARARDFDLYIISALLDEKIIAASMFIVVGNIMQYYLSGTAAEYRILSPSKLIIARAHELAREIDISQVVLGGGVGGARDSLFKFKAGFSNSTYPFYVTKKIFNQNLYNELCIRRSIDPERESFFPAYRVV